MVSVIGKSVFCVLSFKKKKKERKVKLEWQWWYRVEQDRKAPWGQQAILSHVLFPSPCALDVSPLGHTVSVSLLFSMHKHKHCSRTKELEGDGGKRGSDREKDKESVVEETLWLAVKAAQQYSLVGLIWYHSPRCSQVDFLGYVVV